MLPGKKHRTNVDNAQPRTQLPTTPSSADGLLLVSAEGDLWARELPYVRLAGGGKELTPPPGDAPSTEEGPEFVNTPNSSPPFGTILRGVLQSCSKHHTPAVHGSNLFNANFIFVLFYVTCPLPHISSSHQSN